MMLTAAKIYAIIYVARRPPQAKKFSFVVQIENRGGQDFEK